jgi:hypothetical protein
MTFRIAIYAAGVLASLCIAMSLALGDGRDREHA